MKWFSFQHLFNIASTDLQPSHTPCSCTQRTRETLSVLGWGCMVVGGGQASRTGEMPPSTARLWRDDSGETGARHRRDKTQRLNVHKWTRLTCRNVHKRTQTSQEAFGGMSRTAVLVGSFFPLWQRCPCRGAPLWLPCNGCVQNQGSYTTGSR